VSVSQPSQLTPTEQDALVKQIGLAMLRVAPDDWSRLTVDYRAVGRYSEATGQVVYTAGGAEPWPLPPDLSGLFSRLRAGMYREGRGTWFNARYKLDHPSSYNLEYDREEPNWDLPPPPEAYPDDMRLFPRSEDNVPTWMRRRLASPPPAAPRFRVARIFDGPGIAVNRAPVNPDDVADLLTYLDAGPLVGPARGYDVDQMDPNGRRSVPVAFHTDGTWIWPAAVNYYLREHTVAPDPQLVEHIKRRRYELPMVDDATRSAAAAFVERGPGGRPVAPPRPPAPGPTRAMPAPSRAPAASPTPAVPVGAPPPATRVVVAPPETAGSAPAAALPSQGPPGRTVDTLRARLAELGVPESAYRIGRPAGRAWTMEQTDDGWRVGWYDRTFVAPAMFEDVADASAFLLGKLMMDAAGAGRPDAPSARPVQPATDDYAVAAARARANPTTGGFGAQPGDAASPPSGAFGLPGRGAPPSGAFPSPAAALGPPSGGFPSPAGGPPSGSFAAQGGGSPAGGFGSSPADGGFGPGAAPTGGYSGPDGGFGPGGFGPGNGGTEPEVPDYGTPDYDQPDYGIPDAEPDSGRHGRHGMHSADEPNNGRPGNGRSFARPDTPGFQPEGAIGRPDGGFGRADQPNGLDSPAGGFQRPDTGRPDSPAGGFARPDTGRPDSPAGGFARPNPTGLDSPAGGFARPNPTGLDSPAGGFQRPDPRLDSPAGGFARPNPTGLDSPAGGFQRPDPRLDSPAGGFERPDPARPEPRRPEPSVADQATTVNQQPARPPAAPVSGDWPISPLPGEPPLTLFRGKRLVELEPGTEIDRFGGDDGNLVYAVGTPFHERSLVPEWVDRPYHVYQVQLPVQVLTGLAIPWFEQPGGGTAYLLPDSLGELVATGKLVEVNGRERPPA
jgi:nicrotizing toxin Mtb-like protein